MTHERLVRVLLADDHPVFRMGLKGVLEAAPDVRVVAEAGDGDAALARLDECRPDVAVLELDMPIRDGIEVALAVQARRLPTRVVLLTAHRSEALVNKALDSGLSGYLLKDAAVAEILACVRQVHAGQPYVSPQLSSLLLKRRARAAELAAAVPGLDVLTSAERRVLALVAHGRTSREIGETLFISPRTVEHHRAKAGEKLGLRGANALMAFAIAHRSELQ